MFRIRTVPQLLSFIQMLVMGVFFYFLFTHRYQEWLFLFPVFIFGMQATSVLYQWRQGNKQPLKDTSFRYFVLIITLLLLVVIFGNGIK
jgi:hypothetical protein